MAENTEKKKALEAAMSQIEKQGKMPKPNIITVRTNSSTR